MKYIVTLKNTFFCEMYPDFYQKSKEEQQKLVNQYLDKISDEIKAKNMDLLIANKEHVDVTSINTEDKIEVTAQFNKSFPLRTSDNLFDEVRNIWNAAEQYVLQEVGEICKGDANYIEEPIDFQSYYHLHYR
jgi:abortive infection bacteriophage resistance protein